MKAWSHEKIHVRNDRGDEVEAVAPVVISASRATDIPAFYPDWFFARLAIGNCAWVNPFNRKKIYVSFKNCRAIVFWSKNPAPIIPYLPRLDEMGIHYYFQYTLNDYEACGLEANVPPLKSRIEVFKELAGKIGPERIIWRFDPILLMPGTSADDLLARVEKIGDSISGHTKRLVFSFVKIRKYRKVSVNLGRQKGLFADLDPATAEPDEQARREIMAGLTTLAEKWRTGGWKIDIAACGENGGDAFGIAKSHCVDAGLMARIFAEDKDFVFWLVHGYWPERGHLVRLFPATDDAWLEKLRDKGQRKECGCMLSKDIGMYDTCPHLCAYCYANYSGTKAMANFRKHNISGETIAD